MPEEFLQLNFLHPSFFEFVANLVISLGCGIVIALIYRLTYRGASYSAAFVNSLVLLALITSVVILVIGNNLARAFGLVGAMSIIRFRTAVRDVQDIVFIFFSLTVGMAAGVGLNSVAIGGTIFVSVIIILLDTIQIGSPTRLKHLLHVTYVAAPDAEATLQRVLRKHARRIQTMNVRNQPGNEDVQVMYHLSLRNAKRQVDFIRELRELKFVSGVNLLFEEEGGGIPKGARKGEIL
jgi:uncharacterized membrane protein YhiD involved in acid resistance